MMYRDVEKMVEDFGLILEEVPNPQDYECNMIFAIVNSTTEDPTDFIEMLLENGGKVEECWCETITIGFEKFAVEIYFREGTEKECEWLKEPEDDTDWEYERRCEMASWYHDQLG